MPLKKMKTVKKKKSCKTVNFQKDSVKRIYTPYFRKFGRALYSSNTPYTSQNTTGLSPKEKSFVICSCQTKYKRYQELKNMAAEAIKQNKIFSINGNSKPVRTALLDRGWVEKIPQHQMNLLKIKNGVLAENSDLYSELERLLLSNFIYKYESNFIWQTNDDVHSNVITMAVDNNALVNKLKVVPTWTTKQGLCDSIKTNYWFYIEGVSEVNAPRTYNSNEISEIDAFFEDYKITACTSFLKWIIYMQSNDKKIVSSDGNISLNVLDFALKRCKEYLYRKIHKDVDQPITTVKSGQWNAFLRKYYRLIDEIDYFQTDIREKFPVYLAHAKFLLHEIEAYRPQLSCEGYHDIWMIKPAHNSRGRGIRMVSKLGVISSLLLNTNGKYVLQKYIEDPLLIHETKFDIRQYYLVTSTFPLVIWMYQDCYLKFSSQKYSIRNYHESIHLTNYAIQRKYRNCTERHPDLPNDNMWELQTFKNYLSDKGKDTVWSNIIYPGMKKTIIGVMLNCQDSLLPSKNRFELYGCDFILDREYKPWLIEINSSPDLRGTTRVTSKICPNVISDILKVVIDNARNSKAATGNFECVYKQPVNIPHFSGTVDLSVKGYSLPREYFFKGNTEINNDSFYDISNKKVPTTCL